jgi:hypothetical protein
MKLFTGRYRCIFLLCCGWLLAACTPESPTATLVAAVPISTARFTATATARPVEATATPTATLLAATATQTVVAEAATPGPTVTPQPTSTATATATPFPTHYDVPAWASDPGTAVLLTTTAYDLGGSMFITLINPATGERFNVASPPYNDDVIWVQDVNGIYFQYERNYVDGEYIRTLHLEQVNIETGEIRHMPTPDTSRGRMVEAADGRHIAYVSGQGQDSLITIDNVAAGSSVTLADPFNGRYPHHNELTWSPDGNLLMVLKYDFGEDRDDPVEVGLVIYTADGDVFRSYGDFRRPQWAPDSSYRLLYNEVDDGGIYRPCILDVVANSTNCVEAFKGWREEQAVETGWHQWLPGGERISFAYWNREGTKTGLCIIELTSSEMNCPIDQTILSEDYLSWGEGVFIIGYEWSVDGDYLWLRLNPFAPGGDDGSYEHIATIASDGSQFRVWGIGHEAYWRL